MNLTFVNLYCVLGFILYSYDDTEFINDQMIICVRTFGKQH